jgi:phosphatidylinositol glycan class Z
MLAVLIAFGVFNRVTFPAFLLLPALRLRHVLIKYPFMLVTFIMCACLTAAACVYVDTLSYGRTSYVLAPLNNLRYNTDTANLALHGLHSRLNHLFVNIPTLMGPGFVLLVSAKYLRSITLESAVSGVAVLSLVPHQEARFLVPIVPLLCCSFDLACWSHKVQKYLLVAWLTFNIIMGLLIGVVHQGGVVPAQAYIGSQLAHLPQHAGAALAPSITVVWWKTYSPPVWILGRPIGSTTIVDPLPFGETDRERYSHVIKAAGIGPPTKKHRSGPTTQHMTIIDLMGAPDDLMLDALRAAAHTDADTYLVAPIAAVHESPGLASIESTALTEVWHTALHLSLESMSPISYGKLDFGLSIWKISSF